MIFHIGSNYMGLIPSNNPLQQCPFCWLGFIPTPRFGVSPELAKHLQEGHGGAYKDLKFVTLQDPNYPGLQTHLLFDPRVVPIYVP